MGAQKVKKILFEDLNEKTKYLNESSEKYF